MKSFFDSFAKPKEDHAMSLPDSSLAAVDPSKKRGRLASDSSASDSDAKITTTAGISKTKKKVMKLGSPSEAGSSLKESQIRRIAAQSHYDVVSKSFASMEARKDPNYVPIYKKKLFVDSPKSDDPYAIPDSTPDHYRPKTHKSKAPLPTVVSTGSSQEMVTPEPPKNKQKRHTQSSPHPGALFKNKIKGTDFDVPSVGFNSPLSRLSSSRSCAQLVKPPEFVSTPVKIPTQRGLRPSGMSTSALGPRRPVQIDFGEVQSTSEIGTGYTSPVKRVPHRNTDDGAPATERRILSRDSPLRRQRSCSVGSLSDVRESDSAPPVAPPLPKKERSRSVERQLATSELLSTRTLRETPERARSRERGLKKSASSGVLNRLETMPVVTRKMKRAMSTNDLSKSKPSAGVEKVDMAGSKESGAESGSQSSEYHSPMKSKPSTEDVAIKDVKTVPIPMVQDSEGSVYFSADEASSSSPEDDVVPSSQPPLCSTGLIPPVPFRQPCSDLATLSSSSSTTSLSDDVVPCSQDVSASQDVVECSQPMLQSQEEVVASSQALSSQEVVPCSQETIGDILLSSQDDGSSQEVTSGGGGGKIHQPLPLKSALKTPGSENRKNGRRIQFSSLQVYYFGRIQGFHVVPDHGDVALGMENVHFFRREIKVLKTHRPGIDMHDPEESDLSDGEDPGFDRFYRRCDFERNNNERQKLLQNNGVVITRQKQSMELLRQMRKDCGCSCRGGYCRPATCECIRSGIPCQVDRIEADGRYFPCSCICPNLCQNDNGRLVYDYEKVHEERRMTIQRYRDQQRTGIHASPRVRRFTDHEEVEGGEEVNGNVEEEEEEEVIKKTPTREDFLLAPRMQGTPVYKAANPRQPSNNEPPSTPTSFFPRSQSLL